MDTNTIKLTGKVEIHAAGHKIGPNKIRTDYRDKDGNIHAEFFTASLMVPSEQGNHYYRWNVSADEAEAIGNLNIGTLLTVTLIPVYDEKQVVDEDGVMKQVRTERITPGEKNPSNRYHDMTCLDIEVAREGKLKKRPIQYIADVDWEQAKAEAEENDLG